MIELPHIRDWGDMEGGLEGGVYRELAELPKRDVDCVQGGSVRVSLADGVPLLCKEGNLPKLRAQCAIVLDTATRGSDSVSANARPPERPPERAPCELGFGSRSSYNIGPVYSRAA